MSDTCVTCGSLFVTVYEIDGHPIWIDPQPTPDGNLVLRGDPNNIPPGEFVAAFHGVDPDGDEFLGIPPGAPRYQQHDCNKRDR
jgi:hypothetical protein